MIQHIYNLFQEYSTLDSPNLSPGRTQLDTNRTNRTRSSGGKYESARFWGPAVFTIREEMLQVENSDHLFRKD